MALHILQPGLRPIGQFDLAVSNTVTGGEIGVFATGAVAATETAAADVTGVGPFEYNGGTARQLRVKLAGSTGVAANDTTIDTDAAELRFLLDEGTQQYGTLFGSAIGGTAGQGVTYGLSESGAVLANLGPSTHFGSGKVTCWHAPGLYAVSGSTAAPTAVEQAEPNAALYAANGILGTTPAGDAVALAIGAMFDESLVSTSALAATGTQGSASKYAIYFLGQR